jgi:hypothetical protein
MYQLIYWIATLIELIGFCTAYLIIINLIKHHTHQPSEAAHVKTSAILQAMEEKVTKLTTNLASIRIELGLIRRQLLENLGTVKGIRKDTFNEIGDLNQMVAELIKIVNEHATNSANVAYLRYVAENNFNVLGRDVSMLLSMVGQPPQQN